ncbi:MAG: hypothetical protein LBH93_00160 [Chitinispirillales bacterium]|nr:hypothetical protein [Chitinispirillales bacterium]
MARRKGIVGVGKIGRLGAFLGGARQGIWCVGIDFNASDKKEPKILGAQCRA